MADELRRAQGRANARVTGIALVIFAAFFVGAPLLAPLLNQFYFLRFPVGFFVVAQGTVLVVIALIYWFSRRQARIDQRFNVTGDY